LFGHTSTSSYALQALVCLARKPDQWIQAGEIADTTGVPRYYLVKILHSLRRTGFVTTKRGYAGGYRLGRDAESISLYDVVTSVEGGEVFKHCMLGPGNCATDRECPVHSFWQEERAKIKQAYVDLKLSAIAKAHTPKHATRQVGPVPELRPREAELTPR
jgi:Rrf2 family iron-sulfur cluster assembly transcriptional regulator